MQEAGTVLHLARSGRLILKSASSSPVREGAILVDEKGRRTCKVVEIIGPVSSPYLSAQPLTDRIERIEGTKLFVSEEKLGEGERRKPYGRGGKFQRQPRPSRDDMRGKFRKRS